MTEAAAAPATPTPKPKPVPKVAKPVAATVKPAKAAKPAVAAKPAKVAAKPAKAAKPVAKKAKAAPATAKAARGEGARYIPPEEREAIRAFIKQKVRKPMTTGEVGEASGYPAWKVRRSARALVAEGRITMEREGNGGMLTIAPAKK